MIDTRKHRELSVMSKTLGMDLERMREIKEESAKEKVGIKSLSEPPSLHFPQVTPQVCLPQADLTSVSSPHCYKPLVCHPSASDQ